MSPHIVRGGLGIEEMLDVFEIALIDNINEALVEVYSRRSVADQARADRRGYPYVEMTYDDVPPAHFYVGNFPRQVLDEVPPDLYPYIVLSIGETTPAPEDAAQDQRNVYRESLEVHSLAKATDEEGSEVVYRRAIRMAEAVFLVLASTPATAALLRGLSNPTRGQSSIPWKYQYKGRGKDHWFQAVGMNYAITTYTTTNQ